MAPTLTPGSAASVTPAASPLWPATPWRPLRYAPGEAISEPAGAFFMDVATGAVTGYQAPLAPGVLNFHFVSRGHRAAWAAGASHSVYNIPSGRAWQFDPQAFTAWVLADAFVVLLDRSRPGSGPIIASLVDGSARRIDVSSEDARAYLSEDERTLVLVTQPGGQLAPRMTLVDVASGAARSVAYPTRQDAVVDSLSVQTEPTGFTYRLNGLSGEFLGRGFVGWDGTTRPLKAHPGFDGPASPAGDANLSEELLTGVRFQGFGTSIGWTAVTLRSGHSAIRVRSAHVPSSRPWLADGSGVLVHVGAPDDSVAPGTEAIVFPAILRPGTPPSLQRLPPDTWATTPCPGEPDLVAGSRPILYNVRTGARVEARIGPGNSFNFADPWGTRTDQVAFTIPYFGPGERPGPPFLIAPVSEPADAPRTMTFRVAAGSDCLNLREEPQRDAPVIACLAAGTPLNLARKPGRDTAPPAGNLPDPAFRDASHDYDATDLWVYVRTDGGQEGWCAARYLEWASGERL